MSDDPPRKIERKFAEARRRMSVQVLVRELGLRGRDIEQIVRRASRKRPPGMAPALVEPPRGPKPLSGGAAAALEFDD
ncbi:MAG: hypothetical protein B7Z08_07670 [Sphingomonadales bacterium 32-68-7]|nr:MAG: hypothetical protein B7Z33_01770 [Sphingomonadales bacterium 12-68-11]OYX08845.1 MAG: hypothetical protein B7Z08_07670 [Sphingomonadales bacterium 32-68-7]